MPDFICIGGQRTGTTWLHHVLSANETIWMPPCKELHHFDTISPTVPAFPYRYREHLGSRLRHYGLALARAITRKPLRPEITTRLDWDWDLRYFTGLSRSIDWYKGLFNVRSAQGRVTGEITPAYSILPQDEVAALVRSLPDIKIVLILRDPYKRSWSHALKDLPKETAQDHAKMIAFMRSDECYGRSNWPAILDRWTALVPAERMLVLDFGRIASDPGSVLADLAEFLGTSLHLPTETGGSLRERGSSSFKGGALPDAVRAGIQDLYDPIITGTAKQFPEVVEGWN